MERFHSANAIHLFIILPFSNLALIEGPGCLGLERTEGFFLAVGTDLEIGKMVLMSNRTTTTTTTT